MRKSIRILIISFVLCLGLQACQEVTPAASPSPTAVVTLMPTASLTIPPTVTEMPTLTPSPSPTATATPTSTPTPIPTLWDGGLGRIAFVSNRNGTQAIYTMKIDGTDVQQLTDNQANNYDPAWSPDGAYLAFVSDRDENPEIYVMNADGSSQHRVTQQLSAESSPAWSPAGDRLVFLSDKGFQRDILFADPWQADQIFSGFTADFSERLCCLAWSPDGEWLSISVTAPEKQELLYISIVTGESYRFSRNREENVCCLAWKPHDPDTFAFESDYYQGNIRIYHMGRTQAITSDECNSHTPSWSPDGDWLTFSADCDGNLEIYIVKSDGTMLTRLTEDAGEDISPVWKP